MYTKSRLFALMMLLSPSLAAFAAPFSLAISPMTPIRSDDKHIDLRVVITNISSMPLMLRERSSLCDYKVIITNDMGVAVDDTDLAKRSRCDSENSITGMHILLQLKPGESTEEQVSISDFKRVVSPGTYAVQLQRKVSKADGGGVVSSNTIRLIIR